MLGGGGGGGRFKKTLNASRPSEHPLVRGKNVKTFRWDHNNRLQRQNFFSITPITHSKHVNTLKFVYTLTNTRT